MIYIFRKFMNFLNFSFMFLGKVVKLEIKKKSYFVQFAVNCEHIFECNPVKVMFG